MSESLSQPIHGNPIWASAWSYLLDYSVHVGAVGPLGLPHSAAVGLNSIEIAQPLSSMRNSHHSLEH